MGLLVVLDKTKMAFSREITFTNTALLISLITIVKKEKVVDLDILKYIIVRTLWFFALFKILIYLLQQIMMMVGEEKKYIVVPSNAEMNTPSLQLYHKIYSNHQNRFVDDNSTTTTMTSSFSSSMDSSCVFPDIIIGMEEIVTPTSHDILCGRLDIGPCNHVGNKHWRALVNQNISWYMSMPENYKMEVAESLVQEVYQSHGRFLEEDSATGFWYEIDDQKAKIMALRALKVAQDLHLGMKQIGPKRRPPPGIWDIVNPTNHDVLFGCEEESNHHEGNKYWKSWVYSEKRRYATAQDESDKWRVAKRIVQQLRSQDPPGRFLEKNSKKVDVWFDIGDFKAIDKTLQALQEAPDLRLQIRKHKPPPSPTIPPHVRPILPRFITPHRCRFSVKPSSLHEVKIKNL